MCISRLNVIAGLLGVLPANMCTELHADERLLQEVVAGSEANTALIKAGIATYRIANTNYRTGSPVTATETLDVYFDLPNVRTETQGERHDYTIYTPDSVITFDATNLQLLGRMSPNSFSAIVRERDQTKRVPIHPGMHGPETISNLADVIRQVRSNAGWSIKASKDGLLILLEMESEKNSSRTHYRVDPAQRYCIVKATEWALKVSSEAPYFDMSATYRKLENGAFVMDNRITQRWISIDGKLHKDRDEDIQLISIKLEAVNGLLFRIEGLGLPIGARIRDKINGTIYTFDPASAAKASE